MILYYFDEADARRDCAILGISPDQIKTVAFRHVTGHDVDGQPFVKYLVARLDVERELFSEHHKSLHNV